MLLKPRDFALVSIAAAVTTILLKSAAYALTGSVGLLSDALESGINLLTAIFALVALNISARPPDADHAYGHFKVEYLSSGAEGMMIVGAALAIVASAIYRLVIPRELEAVDVGLIISTVAAAINFLVARLLLWGGRVHDSVALAAEAHHLMTDVWTTAGVLVGVGLGYLFDWPYADPLIALAVGVHIGVQGWHIIRAAALGLMDTALPPDEVKLITAVLGDHAPAGVHFHALRTRRSGSQRFASVHIQVPGKWTVQQGHDLLEEIEGTIRQALPRITILTHLEPAEDPLSWEDMQLDRPEADGPG